MVIVVDGNLHNLFHIHLHSKLVDKLHLLDNIAANAPTYRHCLFKISLPCVKATGDYAYVPYGVFKVTVLYNLQ